MKFRQYLAIALVSLSSAGAALADPSGRVGRLVVQGGEVMIAQAGGEWRSVAYNYPVVAGDNLYVAPGGRAEVDFGSGMVWLSGGSTVYFEQLDDHSLRARLGDGQMIVRVRELDRGETARIELRRGSVDFVTPGLYRIESNSAGNTAGYTAGNTYGADLLHVKFGTAQLSSGGVFEQVRGGDAVQFDGGRLGYMNIRGDDDFGVWVDSRDRRFENQRFAYVSPNMVGWRDLDDHGVWRDNGAYGWVWFPRRVANDWAPYRFGHWTHVSPWGWTWVDDAPWGFAPFHYGRWVNLNGRWGWSPGPFERRPVYAPALVAWHGNVGNVSLNVNIGNSLVYWTPLSYGEAYYPSYTVSANYWRVLNRHQVGHTAIYNPTPPRGIQYRNWSVPGGATAVEAGIIASARPVAAARSMGPLPTTSQIEAMPMQDRVKPAYVGASTYSNGAAPALARTAPVMVNEAGNRAVAPQSAQAMPGQLPAAPQVREVQQPQRNAPAAVTQVPQIQAVPQAPQRVMAPQSALPQQALPPQVMPAPMVMQPQQQQQSPAVQIPAPRQSMPQQAMLQPQQAQQAQQVQEGGRRVMPAQGRGEAVPTRQDQTYVEPLPRASRTAAPQSQVQQPQLQIQPPQPQRAQQQPPVQVQEQKDKTRKSVDERPDQKPQR